MKTVTQLQKRLASLLAATLVGAPPIPAHAERLADRERIAVVIDRLIDTLLAGEPSEISE